MQISASSIYAMVFSIAVLLIIMVMCLGLFYIRNKHTAVLFLIGTLGYLVPQIFLRYPILTQLQTSIFPSMNVYLVILVLSGSTALLESIGRWLVIRYLFNHHENRLAGIITGFGHGVCEALFLLAITYVNNLFIVWLSSIGSDSTQISLVLKAVEEIPLTTFYFTLLERVMYVVIQMGLSCVFMDGLLKKKKLMFLRIFVLQFAIDVFITLLSHHGLSPLFLNVVIFLLAICFVLYMWKPNLFPDCWRKLKEKVIYVIEQKNTNHKIRKSAKESEKETLHVEKDKI